MLSLLLLFLSQVSFANPSSLIEAIAAGCGDRVYSEPVNEEASQELMECYETGMHNISTGQYTPAQLGVNICSKFASYKPRQAVCYREFSSTSNDKRAWELNELCEAEVHKVGQEKFKSQIKTERDKIEYKKAALTARMGCIEEAVKEEKVKTGITLGAAEIKHLSVSTTACRMKNTDINNDQAIKNIATCYRTALEALKKPIPHINKLAVDLCSPHETYDYKLACIKNVLHTANDTHLRTAYETCSQESIDAYADEKCGKLKKDVQHCKRSSRASFKSFESFEKYNRKTFECVSSRFTELANFKSKGPRDAATSGAQGP